MLIYTVIHDQTIGCVSETTHFTNKKKAEEFASTVSYCGQVAEVWEAKVPKHIVKRWSITS